MPERDLAKACEGALVARARGASTRQQVRAAARAFVRRHRRDAGYLAWVLRSVGTSSALAIALLGLAPGSACAANAAPFAPLTGTSNPLNGLSTGSFSFSRPAIGDLDSDGDNDLVTGSLAGIFAVHYFPEPARVALLASGSALLALLRRRNG